MSEQISIFGSKQEVQADTFENWLGQILFDILDKNTTEHKHLVIRKNKGYRSVLYRNVIVFIYNFSAKQNWVRFPLRYAHLLPTNAPFNFLTKQNGITINLENQDQAKQYAEIYSAVLDEAIDNGAREYSCCSRYQECSNAGYCTNPYPDIAIECRYKINLKHGRNFFKESKQ